ncbi:DUF3421 domain containing protein [Asbolus verrucosus]|uniref:DUF3421 domain containing protein n=1 Tax=Asbolus verrucosus TaxID=1661398 RepID=A0A482V6I3_ASBVE|nr:DUF3421 domain containing protein [Asbolus verrucosus]
MNKNILFFCAIALLTFTMQSQSCDYYWRDYNGMIPDDAFPGGKDKDGNDIYIGQIYVHCYGLCIGPIFPGRREVEFYCWGTNRVTNVIKILCTQRPDDLKWLTTNYSTFHLHTINKNLVIGGYDGKAEQVHNYYIGRIGYDGMVQIGTADSLTAQTVYFYFLHNNKEFYRIQTYESIHNPDLYNPVILDPSNVVIVNRCCFSIITSNHHIDINDNDVYIGQAYIHGHGLYVGQIIPGETEIAVPCYGVKKTNYLIKILCTKHKENFSWLKTNAATFQTDTIDRHAVIGGYDHVNNNGVLHVGRVMHQGMLKFGNIASYSVDTVWFYFPHKDKEQRSGSYQVLIYNKREP